MIENKDPALSGFSRFLYRILLFYIHNPVSVKTKESKDSAMKYFSLILNHFLTNWSLYLTILALIILTPTILGCGGGNPDENEDDTKTILPTPPKEHSI